MSFQPNAALSGVFFSEGEEPEQRDSHLFFLNQFEPTLRPHVNDLAMTGPDARNLSGLGHADAAYLLRMIESQSGWSTPADMPSVAFPQAFRDGADTNVMISGSPQYRAEAENNAHSQLVPCLHGGYDINMNANRYHDPLSEVSAPSTFTSGSYGIEGLSLSGPAGAPLGPIGHTMTAFPLDYESPSVQTSPSDSVYSSHNSENDSEYSSLANGPGTFDATNTGGSTGGNSSLVSPTLQLTTPSPSDTGTSPPSRVAAGQASGFSDFMTIVPDGTILCLEGACRHRPFLPTGQKSKGRRHARRGQAGQKSKGRRRARRGQFEVADNQCNNFVKHLKKKHDYSKEKCEERGREIRDRVKRFKTD